MRISKSEEEQVKIHLYGYAMAVVCFMYINNIQKRFSKSHIIVYGVYTLVNSKKKLEIKIRQTI